LSGQTPLLENDGSDEVVKAVIEHSRATFATKHVEPEEKPKTKKPEQKNRKNQTKTVEKKAPSN
jgi:hypothetical protein